MNIRISKRSKYMLDMIHKRGGYRSSPAALEYAIRVLWVLTFSEGSLRAVDRKLDRMYPK